MKNNKWSTRSTDDRDMHVVLFVSRNKDNKDIKDFTERRKSFTTKESIDSPKLKQEFNNFVENGTCGEICRMYYSVNSRDEDKVYKDLLHFLIDTPNFNLCSIDSKLAGIAAINSNAKSNKWMFDFDIDDSDKADEFIEDIKAFDAKSRETLKRSMEPIVVEKHRTPHGYAIITSRGFDTRELYKKWDEKEVTLKRDDLVCVCWKMTE